MSEPSARISWLLAPTSWLRHGYDLIGRSFSVLILVRCLLAVHAVATSAILYVPEARNVWVLVAAALIILGWTAWVSWRLRQPSGRCMWVHWADLAVTLGILLATPLAVSWEVAPLALTLHWVAGCALYAAVLRSTRLGMIFSVVSGAVFLAMPPYGVSRRIDLVVILLVVTFTLGELIGQFKATITEQERERIRAVALAERERLSRIVHDGALQVLALVEREGPSLGPRGIRLAALARESESQLRALLRDREIIDGSQTDLVDLAAALDKYQSAKVTVSTMAGQVMVPRLVVDEVAATLDEVLTNVEKHAGGDAQAWVLLDQESDDEVIVWVRDNGVGMTPEELESASARGRMGIKDSIVGRMSAVGGKAVLKSSRGAGTEWELRFPVEMGK